MGCSIITISLETISPQIGSSRLVSFLCDCKFAIRLLRGTRCVPVFEVINCSGLKTSKLQNNLVCE